MSRLAKLMCCVVLLLLASCGKKEQYTLKGRFMEGTYMAEWPGATFEVWTYKEPTPGNHSKDLLGSFKTGEDGKFSFVYEHQNGIKYLCLRSNIPPGYAIYSGDNFLIYSWAWVEANQNKDVTIYAAKQGWARIYLKQRNPLAQGDTLLIKVYGKVPKPNNEPVPFEKEYAFT